MKYFKVYYGRSMSDKSLIISADSVEEVWDFVATRLGYDVVAIQEISEDEYWNFMECDWKASAE